MDNTTIADQFTLLSKLMAIHEENPFKTRSYSNAAFQINRLTQPLAKMDEDAIFRIKGVGEAIGKKIIHMLDTGHFPLLEEYLKNTPPGIMDMLNIKGLGPKKITVVWKELGIEDLGELLYACNENRLTLYKGFGAKTQENVRQSIAFFLASKDWFLYSQAEEFASKLLQYWKNALGEDVQVSLTGEIRRQCNTLDKIELVVACPVAQLKNHLQADDHIIKEEDDRLVIDNSHQIKADIRCSLKENFGSTLFRSTGHPHFVKAFLEKFPEVSTKSSTTEEEIFQTAGLPLIPACLRHDAAQLHAITEKGIPDLIRPEDIKGIIHSHSTWSDGKNSLEEMARHTRDQGYEYLVISDHSQSAGYANGLKADRIKAQHEQIDELNKQLSPFRIFKSIESDILNDGSLDYNNSILSTFDLVIASVHSNLKMDERKAMERLLRAIENPFTTILGHPTGRLLLSRPGYPVDHEQLISACAEHKVVLEINAHPRRLDLDWSWIPLAIEKGVLLSVDPDAHTLQGINDIKYGILSAQQGGLSASNNLSSKTLKAFESFLEIKNRI